jgi:hypothetical protein
MTWIDLKFWCNMKNYIYYDIENIQLIWLHKMKDLAIFLKHLKQGFEHKMTYNLFSTTPNSSRF